ncbi:PaaI family thioesterase [Novosphingobium sp.]|uniref:PaaI family thioesterase n=1 Tax=Novosphingobium sp. TaxID=1874826 RepID=UPI003B52869A
MSEDNADEAALRRFNSIGPFDPALFAQRMNMGGHGNFLGMRYRDHGDTWIELALDWRADLVGDSDTCVIASGAIISLLDNTTSLAVWTRTRQFRPQVTLDLRIDTIRDAVPGKTIIARAECYRVRRAMAFVRGVAHDGDPADPVASVVGIFMLIDGQWGEETP